MTYFKRWLALIFPICYILYLLSCRIIIRDPRFLDLPKTNLQVFVYTLLFIFAVLRLYVMLKKLNVIIRPPLKNKYILKLGFTILKIIERWNLLWIHFYHVIMDKYFALNLWLLSIIGKLYYGQKKLPYIIMLLDMSPQLIVGLLFLLDIFVFKCFRYFYYALPMLLIPLCLMTFLNIILQFHIDNVLSIGKAVIVLHKDPEAGTIEAQFHPDFEPPEYIKDISDFMKNHYIPVVGIVDIRLNYNLYRKDLYYDYFMLLLSLVYVIGWGSILLFY